ncbi:MAG: transcriptional repressor NrdR [Candidatus Hydrogenedentota bacterium]|uniref:Transcriptional repressor NrdR n=1 Tax=Sumerlaea chitinivorans TaxID=2250252 RepID=A0A2Z4YA61_SUMC1|nr:Ribonucleotide reductase transcriptional regulator NrdR [Candidatus Sumerlaea chitinivorans]MCX7963649.1 transcriptional regulator NrdR [Candidatus Sumerlaea chitinivorans]RMH29109.1 MAG: transcriptional repressor NrdR [Candidatus Hydrogenedentota bacterium]GIX43801.1 MAG: transcriptional repressor NrdR [Candidatus Sumerlaea sp.]
MLCPFCGHTESKVVNSRQSTRGDSIRRRRECLQCGHRFTTFEVIEKVPIIVIKRDGKREAFDRQKVAAGIWRACEKRPVTLEQVERIVQFVEKSLYNSMEKEVSSLKIGEMVLRKLREVDEVAYVRFASVYRQFRDVSEFNHEVRVLMQNDSNGS